jgi:hypothetical protein
MDLNSLPLWQQSSASTGDSELESPKSLKEIATASLGIGELMGAALNLGPEVYKTPAAEWKRSVISIFSSVDEACYRFSLQDEAQS